MIDLLPERFNQICSSVRLLYPWVTDGHMQRRSDARLSLKKHSTLMSLALNVDSIEHQALSAPRSLGDGWCALTPLSNTGVDTVGWIQRALKSYAFLCAFGKCFQNSVTHKWRIIKVFITVKRVTLRKNQAEIKHWQENLFICKFMFNYIWIRYF